jgi:phosphoribosyl 1,2-cyclic phosphodiesterase
MRFASLGSGSRGNGLLVQQGRTTLLVDCGFGLREVRERLERLGLAPQELTAVVVTHEHGDHLGGVVRLAGKYALPVYLTHGTWTEASRTSIGQVDVRVFDSHVAFPLGDLEVSPFPVPHDAREPVQFVFSDGTRRLGLLTDTGCITTHVVRMLSGCDALVLECNHDPDLLEAGAYPIALKRRIAGDYGHLSNADAARLLAETERGRLQHVVAAHLSEQNNRPELARTALSDALGCEQSWIGVADQDSGFDWRDIS